MDTESASLAFRSSSRRVAVVTSTALTEMGLLSEGRPLNWEETKALANHVREHGIKQFISLYARLRDRQGDVLKWGDEVEYILVRFDITKEVAQVSLTAEQVLQELNKKELENPTGVKSLWRPEYGAYMIEGTPGRPYGGLLAHFNVVEANMRYRRQELSATLQNGESVMSITNFPRLGSENFTFPVFQPRPNDPESANRSCYFPDEAIFPGHPRFKTLTRNIRMRRGEKVSIKLKVFKDKNTKLPVAGSEGMEPDVVHMDAMGFGMGCCCLQLTFQACNIDEARTLYDHLTPLCPIMLALTAASPAFRGYLTESDCRWNVISASVDCRTKEEQGVTPLKENQFQIAKSRYDSIDSYLSPAGERYNDVPLTYDEKVYEQLREGNIDHLLAQHVAHLFIRDTVSLFEEKIHQNDAEDTDHFENIQSTNWQTMRFKPPPPNSSIGWRVEFRPCEIQMTDFENAAIVCFVVLMTRVILSYQLDFLIPISKVDENMQKAQRRDALRQEKFWFKKRPTQTRDKKQQQNGENGNGATVPPSEESSSGGGNGDRGEDLADEYELMTVDEIINGKKDGSFPGLIPLIHSYLSSMDVDADTHCTIQQYLRLIQKRASGELMTTATWMRNEIVSHPDYKFDSIVSEKINYDLLRKAHLIQEGLLACPQLLGTNIGSKTTEKIPSAIQKHLSVGNACL